MSTTLFRKTSHTYTFVSVPGNGNWIVEINPACSSDLFPGIHSIKISFMVFFFFSILLPLLLHKILIT